MTIAQNIVGMSEIVKAQSEAAITSAKSAKAIDTASLPAALAGHESYLAAAAASSSAGAASVIDQTSWHNLKGMEFVAAEAGRDSTWPFLVGIVCSWLLLGVALPAALPKDGMKNSKYIQRRNGEHVYQKGGHAAAHH
eukprot:CAMPEP_0116916820 /NCGR_PEP_ID=MMETSP0467-20121206/18768_1 /TAXON_ID=283647 /ORGANISM="Mesodinium pulex, Strain SPMC105" /LENGTH=137 /DNA_ID=CAMNT_0004593781 /DNA_START=112 /DNA_END=525 /DNA_ORIENTATION=+